MRPGLVSQTLTEAELAAIIAALPAAGIELIAMFKRGTPPVTHP